MGIAGSAEQVWPLRRGTTGSCASVALAQGAAGCLEQDWAPVCVCHGGVTAQDCDRALRPVALTQNSTLQFQITETFQRRQFFSGPANEISFTFRTEHDGGQIFSSGNSKAMAEGK